MTMHVQFEALQPGPRLLATDGFSGSIGLCYRLPTVGLPDLLTPCERKIVWGLLAGDSNQQVALRNGVSSRTVAVQLQQLFDKVGVNSRHELLATLLRSRGENLWGGHLAHRAQSFTGSAQVFAAEQLIGEVTPPEPPSVGDSRNVDAVWDGILNGEMAVVSTHALGDLRFLSIAPRERLDTRGIREFCLNGTDLMLLKKVGAGQSNQRLAHDFGTSHSGTSVWVRRALAKVGLGHRAELIRLLSDEPLGQWS